MSSTGTLAHDTGEKDLNAALAKIIRCNASDLTVNRAGRISTKQMLSLMYRGIVPLLALLIPMLGLLMLAAAFYWFGPWLVTKVYLMLKFGSYIKMGVSVLALGTLAVLANGVVASRRLLLLVVDLAIGKSVNTVGRVTLSRSDDIEDGIDQILRKRTVMYYFVQRGRAFQVSQEAYDELYEQGGVGYFKPYFTPHSHFLIAIDHAGDAQAVEAQDQAA